MCMAYQRPLRHLMEVKSGSCENPARPNSQIWKRKWIRSRRTGTVANDNATWSCSVLDPEWSHLQFHRCVHGQIWLKQWDVVLYTSNFHWPGPTTVLSGPEPPIQRVHHSCHLRHRGAICGYNYVRVVPGRLSKGVQNYKLFLLCGCTMCWLVAVGHSVVDGRVVSGKARFVWEYSFWSCDCISVGVQTQFHLAHAAAFYVGHVSGTNGFWSTTLYGAEFHLLRDAHSPSLRIRIMTNWKERIAKRLPCCYSRPLSPIGLSPSGISK